MAQPASDPGPEPVLEATAVSIQPPLIRHGLPEAAAAIWQWRSPGSRQAPQAARSAVRRKAGIQALVGACAGALLLLAGSRTLGAIALAISILVYITALVSPDRVHAQIRRMFERLGFAIGTASTYLLMVPLFYLFFLPFGLLYRRGRRDPMERWFDQEAPTYWRRREPNAPSLQAYERQF